MTPFDLLSRWYEEVWNKRNADAIYDLMHDDVIIHGLDPVGTSQGISNFRTFFDNFNRSFPTMRMKIVPLVSDEQTSAVHCTVSARSSDNKDVQFTGLCIARFRDGKIAEGWNNFDFLKMYQQLGHILVAQIPDTSI